MDMSVASFFLCPFGFHLTSKMPLAPQLPRFFGFTRAPEELSSAMERPVSAAPGVFGGAKNGNALQSVYGNLELEISSSLSRFMLIRKFQGMKKLLLLSAFNAILVLFSMQTTWPRMNLCFHSVMMLMLVCEEGCNGRQGQGMLRSRSPFLKPF